MNDAPVPRLDLAPKLNRPLRLWWPPDYLRLLYWAFFFPQAIWWYVEKYSKPEYQGQTGGRAVWDALRRDPIQRQLAFQSLLALALITPAIAWLLQSCGVPVYWRWVAFGMAFGMAGGVVGGVAAGVAGSVAAGVAFGVVSGVAFGVVGGVAFGVAGGVVGGVAFGVAGGMALGVVGSVVSGVAFGVASVVTFGLTFGLAFGLAFGVAFDLAGGVAFGLAFGVAFGMALGRLPDWILSWLFAWLSEDRIWGSRMTWLPLPHVQRMLTAGLESDWAGGTDDVNEVLSYTLQFIPAVGAINAALEHSVETDLLVRVARLADQLFDWNLMRFGSTSLSNQLRQAAIDGLFFIPSGWRRRWKSRWPVELRLDTTSRATCAGFWLWHEGDAAQATDAFAVVRNLRHGPELHGIAHAIAVGQAVASIQDIVAFSQTTAWLDQLPDPELRPGTLAVLRTLRVVSAEARVARNATAPLNRSAALGRANAALTRLLETGSAACLEPEWLLIEGIAEKWRDIISKEGGVVGEEVLRQPALNPYEGYSGLPVTGVTFVGRNAIFQQIETRWAVSHSLPPLILYGHRRMGKSSILRNLGRGADANTILVYLDMQDAGWVDHTGQLLLDFAEAIHRKANEAGLDAGPAPAEADYSDLGTARRTLNALLDRLDSQMAGRRLILAVDEFEIIQQGIEKGRIDPDLLHYLRSKASQYRWLALIFAGLHTLEEMGHDYRTAFGGGAAEHIPVGYLSHDDAIRLITRPHPDFSLEYAPELREELFRLTYGQPYLLQRLCWELVNRWNERFLHQGETTPRELAMDDLAPLLTPDFYAAAGYYFDGVWSNVTDDERRLMALLAQRAEGAWIAEELVAATGQTPEAVNAALDLLRRHDVIVAEAGGVWFASELMRRWVAQYQ